MDVAAILFRQVLLMLILMMCGAVFYKIGFITDQGSKDMGKILLYLVVPCVIINSFCIDNTAENMQILCHSAILTFAGLFLSIAVSFIIFRKDGLTDFAVAFSNCGFMGIPLITATIGSHAVFYMTVMLVFAVIFQWTYGLFLMTGNPAVLQPKKLITNPTIIAALIGCVLFVFRIPLPQIVSNTFAALTGLNAPLSMMVLGVYLAQSDLIQAFKDKRVYLASFVRLLLIPIATVFLFKLIPIGFTELKITILIAASCPAGSSTALFAKEHGKDFVLASEEVCITTLLSLITIPLIIQLASAVL
ncbi:MAG: AEC family transporter [Erysipelotrichaceae bacterium]|nr:AEC family transporter [Erysipelotrichaceae bacterium]